MWERKSSSEYEEYLQKTTQHSQDSSHYMNFCLLYSYPVTVPGRTRNYGFISGKGKLFYLAQGVHTGPRLHHLIQLTPSPEVRRLYPEARPLLLCRSGLKNAWNCTSAPPYASMTWCLIMFRCSSNFTSRFILIIIGCT